MTARIQERHFARTYRCPVCGVGGDGRRRMWDGRRQGGRGLICHGCYSRLIFDAGQPIDDWISITPEAAPLFLDGDAA